MPPKTPATNPSLHPNPTIRKAFLTEALLNLFTLPLLTHPQNILPYLLLHPSQITPATLLFARLFAGIVVGGLTSALLIGATNTRGGIESRRPTYVMLGLGEVALLPVLAAEVAKGGEEGAAISVRAGWVAMGMLVPGLMWRVWVLGMRPDLLGDADGGKDCK